MKTHFFVALVCTVAGLIHGAESESAKLEVHEWGTFTMVSGSDGVPVRWYLPQQSVAELPEFVQHNITVAGKTGIGILIDPAGRVIPAANGVPLGGDLVRMETPVIYFYPEKPMVVNVSVEFKSGRLTEWFPHPLVTPSPFATTSSATKWAGELVPPDDAEATAQMPKVEGSHGVHYAHAREVPAAWYFRRLKCVPNQVAEISPGTPSEKFIFYRGAGDATPPIQANSLEPGRLKLMRFDNSPETITAFALQVEGTRARWTRMRDLPPYRSGGMNAAPLSEVRLQGPQVPVAQAATELGAAMTQALAAAGLSQDEAKAMVATWSDSWFTEDGSRIMVLLPRSFVDSVLPLSIQPAPQKLVRVFVARCETISPDRERTLLTLLQPREPMDPSAAEQFRNLHLGRFANAALQRAKTLLQQHADLQFEALQKASGLQGVTAAR